VVKKQAITGTVHGAPIPILESQRVFRGQ
jgi:hypothetical protein